MKPHTKLYMQFFGYDISDFIPSEISGNQCVDLNHISCKGRGGSKEKDFIENLIALTREEHISLGDKKQYMVYLYVVHLKFVRDQRPDYKIQWDRIPQAYRDEVKNQVDNNM